MPNRECHARPSRPARAHSARYSSAAASGDRVPSSWLTKWENPLFMTGHGLFADACALTNVVRHLDQRIRGKELANRKLSWGGATAASAADAITGICDETVIFGGRTPPARDGGDGDPSPTRSVPRRTELQNVLQTIRGPQRQRHQRECRIRVPRRREQGAAR